MKKEHKILLWGIIAVALLDTIGSIASRKLDFDYSSLSYVSFVVYGATCFLAARTKDLKTGVIYGMILGFFDSTIGLKISMLLEANTSTNLELTTGLWIYIVVFMIGYGAFNGLVGAGLAWIVKKNDAEQQ